MYRLLIALAIIATVSHAQFPTGTVTRTATEAYVTNKVAQGLAGKVSLSGWNFMAPAAVIEFDQYGYIIFRGHGDIWLSSFGWTRSSDDGTMQLPFDEDWGVGRTLASREWTKDYVSTGAPPSGISATAVTNIVRGVAITNNQGDVSFGNIVATSTVTIGGVERSTWPEASAGVPQIWTNMLWGATGTNATYRMSWDVTNGTFKVEELLP